MWRCSTENQRIYDPCFRADDRSDIGDKLICIQSHWDRRATLITLIKPLLNEQANQKDYLKGHNPWAIEFFDGTRCVYSLTGAVGGTAGISSHYTCLNQSNRLEAVSVFDLFDRNKNIWLVFISKKDSLSLEQAPVKTAWY